MNPALLALAIKEVPAALALLKSAFAKDHSGAPMPTDAEIIAAYQSALTSSLNKDAAWLAAHPE